MDDEWVGEIIAYKTGPEQTDKLLNKQVHEGYVVSRIAKIRVLVHVQENERVRHDGRD